MKNLTSAQIATLTALILGSEPKRSATKAEAIRRLENAADDRGLSVIIAVRADDSFETIREAIEREMNRTSTRGGAGLARLRRNTDAQALADQTVRENEAALASAAAERKAVEAEAAVVAPTEEAGIPAFLRRKGARIETIEQIVPVPVATKPAKTPKAKTEKPAKVATERAPRTKTAQDGTITVVRENPKKPGSRAHKIFALYANGQTVAAFVAACETDGIPAKEALANVSWDRRKGFIAVA